MIMEEQKHNQEGVNLNIQRTDMHQFTGMARVQMFTETVMSILRMILAFVMVAGIIGFIGYIGWTYYQDQQAKPVKTQVRK
jgi:hypothetical protein